MYQFKQLFLLLVSFLIGLAISLNSLSFKQVKFTHVHYHFHDPSELEQKNNSHKTDHHHHHLSSQSAHHDHHEDEIPLPNQTANDTQPVAENHTHTIQIPSGASLFVHEKNDFFLISNFNLSFPIIVNSLPPVDLFVGSIFRPPIKTV